MRYMLFGANPISMLPFVLVLCIVLGALVALGQRRYARAKVATACHPFSIDKPLIFPGKILHIRHFPALHKFTYPYLMVGVPVTGDGKHNSSILSVDIGDRMKRSWLRVEANDHLGRGDNFGGLRQKLDRYLESQNLDPSRYKRVYLVTTPRLFNHHFTPASFWYLYLENNECAAMIAEVNNTFNERRVYFVPKSSGLGHERDTPLKSDWFHSHDFKKDFHVSPFSSRRGAYTLAAKDPLSSATSTCTGKSSQTYSSVDIKVNLLSSKGHRKIYARTWCQDEKIADLTTISKLELALLLLTWFWMSRITYFRIVVQALKLSYQRKLHMWHRPEPRLSSISRRATKAETALSRALHDYLAWLGHTTGHYRLAKVLLCDTSYVKQYLFEVNGLEESKSLVLNIHTPNFYSSILDHNSLFAFLQHAVLNSEVENRTASSPTPAGLISLIRESELRAQKSVQITTMHPSLPQSSLTTMLRHLNLGLRISPPAPPYPAGNPKFREQMSVEGTITEDSYEQMALNICTAIPLQQELSRMVTFLDGFVDRHFTAEKQWNFYFAILEVLVWRWMVRLTGGMLSWGA